MASSEAETWVIPMLRVLEPHSSREARRGESACGPSRVENPLLWLGRKSEPTLNEAPARLSAAAIGARRCLRGERARRGKLLSSVTRPNLLIPFKDSFVLGSLLDHRRQVCSFMPPVYAHSRFSKPTDFWPG
jgi:hypothetical protein